MIYAYLDESGNLGRGGKFFTIAATVFDNEKGKLRVKRIIKRECLRLSKSNIPLSELKFYKLNFNERQRILNKIIQKADLDLYYITAKKSRVTLLQQGRDKNLVYNYLAGLLVEKIILRYNDDITFCFDQRSTKVTSMNSLCDYLEINAYKSGRFTHTIHVKQYDSKSMYNLQAADAIAGAINGSFERNSFQLLNIIKPRIVTSIKFPWTAF